MRLRCPDCKVEAEIDKAARTVKVTLEGDANALSIFPKHEGCELAKSLDEMDVDKLEQL